ncbi:MAG: VOC family protein [Armatimonadota bacterium]|nr:VOC family protein [Armatimonadota bacterium]MDR7448281.1 VOC family protein [Armatimonadota bacterium]MDR7458311.1 VOC family protein [Armatimonadota bacterium]MDR7478386.1 VOC family protein [Armatimonadota bacterium]MDR7490909.1 VOC family protein [Armatimonadota bacterium]
MAAPSRPEGLSHVLLQVGDLAAAERFFVDVLGFTVRDRGTLRDGRPLVVLQQGLGLTARPAGIPAGPGLVDHIAFRVRDLDALRARLLRAGLPSEGPVTTAAYGTSIYVVDPDGTRIELHDRWRDEGPA